jgi:hypothetical protein
MLSALPLLPHWPGLPAEVRNAVLHLDASDPCALVATADLLVRRMDLDLAEACELVGIEERLWTQTNNDIRSEPWTTHLGFAISTTPSTTRT